MTLLLLVIAYLNGAIFLALAGLLGWDTYATYTLLFYSAACTCIIINPKPFRDSVKRSLGDIGTAIQSLVKLRKI
jgi:hypothetical protein